MPRSRTPWHLPWSSRPFVLGVLSLTLALGIIACGGDDEEPSGDGADATATASTDATATAPAGTATTAPDATGTTSAGGSGGATTGEGNRIAQEAMIVEADLPGAGWVVTATDEFGGSLLDVQENDEFADIPACNAYTEQVMEPAVRAEESRVGRAAKAFTQSGALLGTSVNVEVSVYEDGDVPGDLISAAKDAFNSSEFEECFREIFQISRAEIPEDVQFELVIADPLTSAPNDGVAEAFDLEFSAAGIAFAFHAEMYAWADGDTTAFVNVLGDPGSVTSELVEAAVGKTDEKLSAAQ